MPQFLMPYAVDNPFFARRAEEATAGEDQLRSELGLQPGHPVILFASKLQRRKHCDHLIEAYTSLLRDYDSSGYKPYLVIVGNGEERANLEARCHDLGLANVRFTGFQKSNLRFPATSSLPTSSSLPLTSRTLGADRKRVQWRLDVRSSSQATSARVRIL